MKRLEVSGAVRPLYRSLGVKGLSKKSRRSWSLSERFVGKKNLISVPGICCFPLLRTGNIGCSFFLLDL